MTQISRPIPDSVAFALATLSQPSGLTEFIRVYGPDRGVSEWECHHLSKREALRKAEAAAVLDEARQFATENGWDWQAVEAAARQVHPQLFPTGAA